MKREINTTVNGEKFHSSIIDFVWSKALEISGCNKNLIRLDALGNKIKKSDFGDTNSEYGWEIDHIKPVKNNGLDYLDNLQPLQWKANRLKGDNYPNWSLNLQTPNFKNLQLTN